MNSGDLTRQPIPDQTLRRTIGDFGLGLSGVAGVLVLALVLVTLIATIAGSLNAPGGASEVLWSLVLIDDTVYGSRYTDTQFNLVCPGMSEAEVLARLGEPLDTYFPETPKDWDKGMRWSRSANDSHYKVRAIIFKNGRVAEKFEEFYVD